MVTKNTFSIRMLDYYISNGVLKAHNYDSRAIINWEVVKTIYGAWTHSIIRARKWFTMIDLRNVTCLQVAEAWLENGIRKGKRLLYLCPIHDDKSPSLLVNPDINCWMCGPCGKSGNYWALVAFLENLSTNDKPATSNRQEFNSQWEWHIKNH